MPRLPHVTPEKAAEIMNWVREFPEISRHYARWLKKALATNDPRRYPLVKQFLIGNRNFLALFEGILKELSEVKGFESVVKQSKNKDEFYDQLSVLKLGLILRSVPCSFEFIPVGKTPAPDIKAEMWGKDTYFEVKHLRDIDEISDILLDYFGEYPSSFILSIIFKSTPTLFQTNELIERITKIMEKGKADEFPKCVDFGLADVRIIASRAKPKTPLAFNTAMGSSSFLSNKQKIESVYLEAMNQLKTVPSASPSFIVLEIEKILIDFDDIEPILYGEKGLCVALFSTIGSEVINGVICLGKGKPTLFVNPMVDKSKRVDCLELPPVFDVLVCKIANCSD